jgi:hypothetical protein
MTSMLGDAQLLGQDRDADHPLFAQELLDATVPFRLKRLRHAAAGPPDP